MTTNTSIKSELFPLASTIPQRTPAPMPTEFDTLKARVDEFEADHDAESTEGAEVRRDEGGHATPVTAPVTVGRQRGQTKAKGSKPMEATQTTVPNAGANAPTFEHYLKVAVDLGASKAKGDDAQTQFMLQLIEGGYLGTLDTSKDKHGKERSDAFVLSEAYAKSRGISTMFLGKADNERKLLSNVAKAIKFGGTPKWGQGEPLNVVNTLMTRLQHAKKVPGNVKRLLDPVNMMLKFMTAQLKQDRLFDDEELDTFLYRNEAKDTSAERVIEGIRRQAQKLLDGKVPHCPDMDDSAEIKAIVASCTKRLTAIAKARKTSRAESTAASNTQNPQGTQEATAAA